jgi:hypothetical protein
VLTLPKFHVVVCYPRGVAMAGDSWSDFMDRMVEESAARSNAAAATPPALPDVACNSCGDLITSTVSYSCTVRPPFLAI